MPNRGGVRKYIIPFSIKKQRFVDRALPDNPAGRTEPRPILIYGITRPHGQAYFHLADFNGEPRNLGGAAGNERTRALPSSALFLSAP